MWMWRPATPQHPFLSRIPGHRPVIQIVGDIGVRPQNQVIGDAVGHQLGVLRPQPEFHVDLIYAWGDEVKFYVDVAAGYPSNLANLKENVFIGTWDKFREDKLNGGGGESLGLPDRYETDPRQLYC